jgi:hypothetical protein
MTQTFPAVVLLINFEKDLERGFNIESVKDVKEIMSYTSIIP